MLQDPVSNSFRFVRPQEDRSGGEKLRQFLNKLHSGGRSFRYFESRDRSIIQSHETTLLLESGEEIVAYGHLEREGERLWLGVAVADGFTGLGWGEVMMRKLITIAREGAYRSISLSVDDDNHVAISLYRKMGFTTVDKIKRGTVLIMEKEL